MKQAGKIVRIVGLVAVSVAVLMLIILSAATKPSSGDKVWDSRTTVGSLNAKNYYVQYTDLACPYCSVFSRNLMDNFEEFKRDYIEGKDILYEVRVTDFLYEYGEHKTGMSRWGAAGTYCATQEDKFWEYYHAALKSLWKDYHSKGIGVSKESPMIEDMTKDYWVKIGEKVGFDKAEFASCMDSGETVEAIQKNTAKAAKSANGMPYFVFNKFVSSGFDNNWGWDYVKEYLDAGLRAN